MPEFGLLPEGFIIPTVQEIREDIEAELRDEYGESIPLGDGTLLGHIVGILAERLGLLWEVTEQSYSAMDPDKATGSGLDSVSLLTGTFRADASPSEVTLTLTGDDGAVVASGNLVSTASTVKQFETTEDVTITLLDSWVALTVYGVDARVTNAGRSYHCTVGGTSAGAGGPTTEGPTEVDGTVTWQYLGEGDSAIDVDALSVEDGPIVAVSGDITVIDTPTGGWSSVTNLLDAEVGRLEMTDEELRILREAELSQPGTSPADAIRAALLSLSEVTAATVFYNNTDATDADGVPPHSVEALVQGGDDEDIWQCLWDNVAAGIATHGDEVGTVVDDEGTDQTLKFSRPTEIDVWIEVTLTKSATLYLGDEDVKLAIVEWGNDRGTGYDVVSSGVLSAAFAVEGVLNIPSFPLIGTSSPPVSSATLSIGTRQLAVYDTSRIDVISTDGVP
jgi:uncharacterized phage protein gp47/JayE